MSVGEPGRLAAEYVLPLKWNDDDDLDEPTDYLVDLSRWLDVTVVDGSPPLIFARHAQQWAGLVRHRRPDAWPGRNGKVAGVMTGVRRARHDRVVIADDDVRWDRGGLGRALPLLAEADLVRPQNYFLRLPWHACHDSARSLLNRALGADYPGTYLLRRDVLLAAGGYDGDVLFENLELSRTIRAAGGRELFAPDLFVARRPPTARHFLGQRVRQAYDDLAQPVRLLVEAALLPLFLLAVARRRGRAAAGLLTAAALGLAEVGHAGRPAARCFRRSQPCGPRPGWPNAPSASGSPSATDSPAESRTPAAA